MAEDKTEEPTQRRLDEARRKGQVARSKEAGQAASLMAATIALGWMGSAYISQLSTLLRAGLTRMGATPTVSLDAAEVSALAINGVSSVGLAVAPIALTAAVTVVALHVGQGGWNVGTEALTLNWGRLSPANGIKRLSPGTGGIELLRATVSVTVIAVLSWKLMMTFLGGTAGLALLSPEEAARVVWTSAAQLIRQAAIGLLAIAAADYFVQRHQMMKGLRMTKQEVRDDAKLSQGNPEIKARVRRIQREMMKRRMLSATRNATVVITNPTHYAVALEYKRSGMSAPIVVAKGRDLLAQRIKDIAREHGVPTVENVQLARALYAGAEVGDVIPGDLFEAVAEVLAYLIRLKQLVF